MKLLFFNICILFLSNIYINSSEAHSEGKDKNQIFISEKHMRRPKNILPDSSKSSKPSNNPIDNKISKNTMEDSNILNNAVSEELPVDEENNIGDGPIFFSGWVKYFKYSETDMATTKAPKHFFQNNAFFEQAKLFPNANYNSTDSDGKATYIRDKAFFWLTVFADTLNFVSNKKSDLQTTYDTLAISNIQPVWEDDYFKKGGITDFGNFNEGYCCKIQAKRPRFSWIICAEDNNSKGLLMATLKKLKVKIQRDDGQILITPDNLNTKKNSISDILNGENTASSFNSDSNGNLGVTFNSTQKITDGYWIVLQDWSQCDRACGGGNSTLHRMCIPPKSGGRDCIGEPIITRKCNPQPCPDVYGTEYEGENKNTTTLKPIVKVMPFSSRPQRYTKCVIKEGDLMLFTQPGSPLLLNNPLLNTNADGMDSLQIPTRAIMNNRTLSLFAGDEYSTLVISFNMKETMFSRSIKHSGCFILNENNKKKAELCPFGCESSSKAIEEWDYDFNLFKIQCNTPRDIIELNQQELTKKLEDKIKDAKNQLLGEREEELKKKVAEKEEEKINAVIENTNKVALQAIAKEMNLEQLIRSEEAQREAREEKELLLSIEAEKRKSECLVKAIKERKIENQYNLRAKQAEEEVQKIKEVAAEQVSVRRSQLSELLSKMRKDAERKKARLKQKLQNVRNDMAQQMGKAYKKGDFSNCEKSMNSDEFRKTYCTATFMEDYNNYSLCLEGGEEFCVLCCETEYGDFYLNERQECFKNICGNPKSGKDFSRSSNTGVDGRWIWHEAVKPNINK